MSHRASYWTTTSLSFASAAVSLILPVWIPRSWLPWIAMPGIYCLLALDFVASMLIAAGGLVCLWRDARDAAGKPDVFARLANSQPRAGLLARIGLRSLQGSRLRPADIVQVRPLQEIRATLGADGTLDGLPFMPEMEALCGRIFQVHRRIDKINDMRNKTGLRRMRDTVTLSGVRCGGACHGGCQAECQILWKDAWLRRLPGTGDNTDPGAAPARLESPRREDRGNEAGEDDRTYVCQMTELWRASHPMSPRDIRQDLRAIVSGNLPVRAFVLGVLTRLFNRVQGLRGGAAYPFMPACATCGATPSLRLDLAANDSVIVRDAAEIARTLVRSRNRGLWFDREMIRYCGRPATVRSCVHRIIHEASGRMIVMKTPCIVLEEGVATGEFLRFCPQHEYIFWREIWLRRTDPARPDARPG